MTCVHFVVLVALSGPPHVVAVASRCTEASQLGLVNSHLTSIFSDMRTLEAKRTCKSKTSVYVGDPKRTRK